MIVQRATSGIWWKTYTDPNPLAHTCLVTAIEHARSLSDMHGMLDQYVIGDNLLSTTNVVMVMVAQYWLVD
jgi:hypothetical protein